MTDCECIDRWDGVCPDCGDVAEPDSAGIACECGSFMHGELQVTGSWLIGPTHQGPADKDTRCPSCNVDLEDFDHEPWCDDVVWGEREAS
jgi:hypothetical protein